MAAATLVERHAANLHSVGSCSDRTFTRVTLPGTRYAYSMTSWRYPHNVRSFERRRIAERLRERIRERALALADGFDADFLYRRSGRHTQWLHAFRDTFYWSINKGGYGIELMFHSERIPVPPADAISHQAVRAANADRVAGRLGSKVTPQVHKGMGSRPSARISGRGAKRYMGAGSMKAYAKVARVSPVATNIDAVSPFRHHRELEHKDGQVTHELAPLMAAIHSLPITRRGILAGCNLGHLASLSSLDHLSADESDSQRLNGPHVDTDQSING